MAPRMPHVYLVRHGELLQTRVSPASSQAKLILDLICIVETGQTEWSVNGEEL